MGLNLTSTHYAEFERDGFTIARAAYTTDECRQFIDYMLDLKAGRSQVEGFCVRSADDWDRSICRNLHNPQSLAWMLDGRLRHPITEMLGAEPDGVQSMYFYIGSEQRRHQDNYYLPGCISAWVALQEVNSQNGSIRLQIGSHLGPSIHKRDFLPEVDGTTGAWFGWNLDDAFDILFEQNRMPEIPIEANCGDVVFFHGGLIHRGGPILEPGSFRHSWAGHYIPRAYDPWPYEGPPRLRVSFDGICRFTPTR